MAESDHKQGQGCVLRRISVFGSAGAILIALCGLLGYVPGLQSLGRVREGFIPMAPSTAISFILLGGVLASLSHKSQRRTVRTLLGVVVLAISLFGALEVAGYFSGRDLSFEDALVPSAGYLGEIPIARMSPATGAGFFIAGLASLALVVRVPDSRRGAHLEQWAGCLGSLVIGVSLVFCLAYSYGTPLLYGRGATVPMALTTALAFLMLGASAVGASGSDAIPVKLLAGCSTRSYLLRVFLPLTTLPVLLGGFAVPRVGMLFEVNPALVAATTAVFAASITGVLCVWIARRVARVIDRAEQALRQSEERLEAYSQDLEETVEERTEELLHAQEALVRKEKLAILGALSGGVGHELRNPLGVISNAVFYLKTVLADGDEKTREYLGIISSEVSNAVRIVSDLLDFSRTRTSEREEIVVSELVARALEKHPPPEEIIVSTEIATCLPGVFVDPRQIEQVLINLITNAHHAMPEGGTLTVKAEQEKDVVGISVTDTGCGISEEHLDQVFEPLFTTKARGIGLGLSVSRNLLDVNGGSIAVKSKEGRGSTFTVVLPLAAKERPSRRAEEPRGATPKLSGTKREAQP